jgi:Spy/CpxP family protein refolding chaperone
MMKPYTRLLLLLSVVAVVAAASHVLCHRLGCGKHACATKELSGWHNSAWLASKLKLAPEQQAKFNALEAKYRAALAEACAKHRELQAKLDGMLFAADGAAADGLLAEMSRLQLQMDTATVRQIRDLDALLTPEQRQVFRELLSTCLCGKCPATGTQK